MRFLAALALVLLAASPAHAGNEILKGLPKTGFNVVVEPLDPEAKQAGLKEESLAKVVQQRMQKRKVAFNQAETNAELYVRVVVLTSRALNGDVLGYGAHVEASFREKAVLKRDKLTEFMAPVWFKGNVTVANPKQFVTQTVHVLAELTDQFLTDYQAQNP